MGRSRLLGAPAVAALLALAGCTGAAKETVRTIDGSTSTTTVSGQAAEDSTSTAGGTSGSGASNGGGGTPGGQFLAAAGPSGSGAGEGGAAAPAAGAGPGSTTGGSSSSTGSSRSQAPPSASATPAELVVWCPNERRLESRLQALDVGAPASQLRAAVAAARTAIPPALDPSPAEIRGDLRIVADGYEQLFAGLEQADYDISKVPPSALQGMTPARLIPAADHVSAYGADHCQ